MSDQQQTGPGAILDLEELFLSREFGRRPARSVWTASAAVESEPAHLEQVFLSEVFGHPEVVAGATQAVAVAAPAAPARPTLVLLRGDGEGSGEHDSTPRQGDRRRQRCRRGSPRGRRSGLRDRSRAGTTPRDRAGAGHNGTSRGVAARFRGTDRAAGLFEHRHLRGRRHQRHTHLVRAARGRRGPPSGDRQGRDAGASGARAVQRWSGARLPTGQRRRRRHAHAGPQRCRQRSLHGGLERDRDIGQPGAVGRPGVGDGCHLGNEQRGRGKPAEHPWGGLRQ